MASAVHSKLSLGKMFSHNYSLYWRRHSDSTSVSASDAHTSCCRYTHAVFPTSAECAEGLLSHGMLARRQDTYHTVFSGVVLNAECGYTCQRMASYTCYNQKFPPLCESLLGSKSQLIKGIRRAVSQRKHCTRPYSAHIEGFAMLGTLAVLWSTFSTEVQTKRRGRSG